MATCRGPVNPQHYQQGGVGAVGGGVVGVSYWCRRWRMRNRWEFLGEVSNVEKKKKSGGDTKAKAKVCAPP